MFTVPMTDREQTDPMLRAFHAGRSQARRTCHLELAAWVSGLATLELLTIVVLLGWLA